VTRLRSPPRAVRRRVTDETSMMCIAYITQDKFYEDCSRAGKTTQLAYADGAVVGAVACRLELDPRGDGARLYIMTLGVYAAYRDGKIGSRLLQHALNEASRDEYIKDAYLHVQTNNEQAFAFYDRFGFVKGEVLKNYYKRIEPPDAVVLSRNLRDWVIEDVEGVEYTADADE
jgi:N-alpha-acetyltransferase 50